MSISQAHSVSSWLSLRNHGIYGLFLLFLGTTLLGTSVVYGQEDDYEEWKQKQEEQYQDYLNQQDKAFLKFLKKQWTDVEVRSRMGSPIDNKPEDIPTIGTVDSDPGPSDPSIGPPPSGTAPEQASPESQAEEETAATNEPTRQPEPDPVQEPSPQENPQPRQSQQPGGEANLSEVSLSFFGIDTVLPYSSSLVPSMEGAPGKESIRTFWRSVAEQDYSATLDAVQQEREDLNLSDWGYYVYVRDVANQLYQRNGVAVGSNEATLWTWFMLMKSGYSVRVGYRDNNVFLMLPVNGQIFNRPQLQIDGQKYYLMVEEGSGSLRTYEGQHETADAALKLDEAVLPEFGASAKSRSASFSYDDQRFNVEFEYSPAVLDYLEAYPNVELEVLFRTGVSPVASASLRNALQPHVEDRTPRDALNFLLRFTQFATDYKRDRDNFGEERFLFAEESLAASASDCEDRAVLYAYLVRDLLGREMVALKWPSHVATAVKAGNGLEATSDDRTLTIDGETYIMADPTYIGSSLGMEMPFVEGKDPEVIAY